MFGKDKAAVVTCKVTECSYNMQEQCRAPQIEVGDDHPRCDTFTTSGATPSTKQEMPTVGACHVKHCSFNKSDNCDAPGITVMHHTSHADCGSYRMS